MKDTLGKRGKKATEATKRWRISPATCGKCVVGCRLVLPIKVVLDGTIDHLKARIVAKG